MDSEPYSAHQNEIVGTEAPMRFILQAIGDERRRYNLQHCTQEGVQAKYHRSRVVVEQRRRTLIFEHVIFEVGKVVYQATVLFCKHQITANTYLYNLESNLRPLMPYHADPFLQANADNTDDVCCLHTLFLCS
jgi:hypothetical protein